MGSEKHPANRHPDPVASREFVGNLIESALRIGLLFLLLAWSFDIVRPFIIPLMWGAIVAIALMPVARKLSTWLGGRRGMSAGLLSILGIVLLVVPAVIVTKSALHSGQHLAEAFVAGNVRIPDPSPRVAQWPLIGEQIYEFWTLADSNLEEALLLVEPQLKTLGNWLLAGIRSAAGSVLLFVVSLIIAGFFMARADAIQVASKRLAVRVVGENGADWADLSVATVRSVVQGVLGVALIQAALAGVGLFAMGIPAAGIWVVLVMLLAIMQLPALLVLGPIIFYVWSVADTTPAVFFTVWMLLVGLSDNLLKPMLLGRGLDIPMPVILLGAIGGMISSGIIGLFIGAVILAIWYKLFLLWLDSGRT